MGLHVVYIGEGIGVNRSRIPSEAQVTIIEFNRTTKLVMIQRRLIVRVYGEKMSSGEFREGDEMTATSARNNDYWPCVPARIYVTIVVSGRGTPPLAVPTRGYRSRRSIDRYETCGPTP